MKRAGMVIDVVYMVVVWAGFWLGILTHNPWLAAPGAFLILLEKLDEQ